MLIDLSMISNLQGRRPRFLKGPPPPREGKAVMPRQVTAG